MSSQTFVFRSKLVHIKCKETGKYNWTIEFLQALALDNVEPKMEQVTSVSSPSMTMISIRSFKADFSDTENLSVATENLRERIFEPVFK